MTKKYELTDETRTACTGETLYRIRALVDIASIGVKAGDLGGWVASEKNLSQIGDAWVADDAQVSGFARVYGDALVYSDAQVYGYADVYDGARVSGLAQVSGFARVYGDALVYSDAKVYGTAQVSGNAQVSCDADLLCLGKTPSGWAHIVRHEDGWRLAVGCKTLTPDELREMIAEGSTIPWPEAHTEEEKARRRPWLLWVLAGADLHMAANPMPER